MGKLVPSSFFDFKHLNVQASCRSCLHTQTLIMEFSHHREPIGPFNAHWHVHITVSQFVALLSFPLCIPAVFILNSFAWKEGAFIFCSYILSQPGDFRILIILPWLVSLLFSNILCWQKRAKFAVATKTFSWNGFHWDDDKFAFPSFLLFQICSCFHWRAEERSRDVFGMINIVFYIVRLEKVELFYTTKKTILFVSLQHSLKITTSGFWILIFL